jgi:hypothetical protein
MSHCRTRRSRSCERFPWPTVLHDGKLLGKTHCRASRQCHPILRRYRSPSMPSRSCRHSNSRANSSLEEWTCSASVMNRQVGVEADAVFGQNAFVGFEPLPVDDEHLVLVELHFLRQGRVEHGDAGTAVVGQQVFVLVQNAFEHRQVDLLAVQVRVPAGVLPVARLQHDIHRVAERVEQVDKQVEQNLAVGGGHQHGYPRPGLFVGVKVVTITLLRRDLQVVGGPHGVGQGEPVVRGDAEMRFELFFGKMLEAPDGAADGRFVGSVSENFLRKPIKCLRRICGGAVLAGSSLLPIAGTQNLRQKVDNPARHCRCARGFVQFSGVTIATAGRRREPTADTVDNSHHSALRGGVRSRRRPQSSNRQRACGRGLEDKSR